MRRVAARALAGPGEPGGRPSSTGGDSGYSAVTTDLAAAANAGGEEWSVEMCSRSGLPVCGHISTGLAGEDDREIASPRTSYADAVGRHPLATYASDVGRRRWWIAVEMW